MSATCVERLFTALTERSEREALRFEERSWSFGELNRLSRRYARGLSDLGIRAGDRVAVFAESAPEVVVALLGNHRLGVIHVPINTRYRGEEARHILEDSGARAVIIRRESECSTVLRELGPAGRPERVIVIGSGAARSPDEVSFERLIESTEAAPEPAPGDDDIALIVYTSGTTGKSKGAALSFRSLVSNIEALTGLWRFSPEDRIALTLPLFHIHGLCIGVHGALLNASTVLLLERFEAREVARCFEEERPTVFMGVPTMYVRILELLARSPGLAPALARARLFTSGSAPLPANDFAAFEDRTGHRILERYGMTETLFTLSNPYEGERRPGSVGRPVPDYEARIVGEGGEDLAAGEEGELLVRGNGMMSGYWGRPEETRAAFREGWFATGDLARRDADGYVRILGRKSTDFIKTGGFKVSSREVEDVLREHPRVREVVVVGVPDRVWGERIVAAVVLRPSGAPPPDASRLLQELASLCAGRLADYKRPREVRLLEEIPRNAMGKVQKHRILQEL